MHTKKKRVTELGDGNQSPAPLHSCRPWEVWKSLRFEPPLPLSRPWRSLEIGEYWTELTWKSLKIEIQRNFSFLKGRTLNNVCFMFVYHMLCYIFVCGLILYLCGDWFCICVGIDFVFVWGLILYSWLEKCFSFEKSFEMANAHMLLTVLKCTHASDSFEMYTCSWQFWNVHMLLTVLKCTHAPDSFEMCTCSWQFWNVHMLLTVLKCTHASDSFEMYTCSWQFWNVHMLLTVLKCSWQYAPDSFKMYMCPWQFWNLYMLQTVLKCVHAPDSFEIYTCSWQFWNVQMLLTVWLSWADLGWLTWCYNSVTNTNTPACQFTGNISEPK